MKRISFIVLLISACVSFVAFAQPIIAQKEFPPVRWLSKGTFDMVKIDNPNNQALIIQIAVDKIITVEGAAKDTVSAGINLKNCGNTTHLDPGSSVICNTSDSVNPVQFGSDSEQKLATGSYQVQIQ